MPFIRNVLSNVKHIRTWKKYQRSLPTTQSLSLYSTALSNEKRERIRQTMHAMFPPQDRGSTFCNESILTDLNSL